MPEKLEIQQSGAVLFFPWQKQGFCDLLGTEQPLWCKKLFSEPQPGLHMPEALPHEPQVLPSQVSQARSGLCSLQLNLTQGGWVCIHPDPAPCSSPKALQRCSLRAGSWMDHQASEQGSVQWGQQGLGLQPFSASAVGDGSRDQGAFLVSTCSLARDIMPLLFQNTREKETPNPKLSSMGLGKENKC